MSSKDGIKLATALGIIALAVVLFVYRTRAAAEAGDDAKTYWYCTKANKSFELSGPDYDKNVRTGRKEAESGDSGPRRMRGPGTIVTQAKSPYTGDWTGVPAIKCGDCGEIFPLQTDPKGENLCPKCQWNPATQSKGAATPEAPPEKND